MDMYFEDEEIFLDELFEIAMEASKITNGEWNPNFSCTEKARKNRDYCYEKGMLNNLTFFSAHARQNKNKDLIVNIILKSSYKSLTIRVIEQNEELRAEIIVGGKAIYNHL